MFIDRKRNETVWGDAHLQSFSFGLFTLIRRMSC